MNTAAGAWSRTARAAGVGKSLWLSYAFAGPAGDAPAWPPQGPGGRGLAARLGARSRPRARAAGGPRSPGPAAADGQSQRPRRRFVPASGRLGPRCSRCRRRCERSRDAIQECPQPRAPRTALSPVPPAARPAVPGLLPAGTPALLFRTCGGAGSEGEAAFPTRAPGRPAPRGGGARRHREKLLRGAEAVGGGRRRRVGEARALLSPKSKVLGAVSRTRSPGSRGRLLRAGLRLLKETRQPAPALSLPPPRWDECA